MSDPTREVLCLEACRGIPDSELAVLRISAQAGDIARLEAELAQARETNRRLNARCQLAEKALRQMLSPVRRGGSMARAFLAWHNHALMEEVGNLTAPNATSGRHSPAALTT